MKRWIAAVVVALIFANAANWAQGAEGDENPKHEKAAKPSPIKDQAYNAETKVLTITFVSGKAYEYAEVPKEVADALAATEHKGHYYHKEIKGKFKSTKVEPAPEKKTE